jgi:DNA-binding response OmpR family regulator
MAQKRILVVNDTVATHRVVDLLLRHGGYEVDTAFDRRDAVTKARERTPDLILMDVEMPLDGLLGHRRAPRGTARVIQIIAVIAHGPICGDCVAFECDGAGCALSPINSAELLAKVRLCLGG